MSYAKIQWLIIFITIPFCIVGKGKAIEPLIKGIKIEQKRITVHINDAFKKKWLTRDFFAEYEDPSIDLTKIPETIAHLPFILNIYPVVWISGKKYSIKSMDRDIYFSLKKIKKIFKRMYPHTKFKGEIVPKKLVINKPQGPLIDPEESVAILFSGGLDSTACSFKHAHKKQLLISMQGQADIPMSSPSRWKQRAALLTTYAQDRGYSNTFVHSNYTEFLKLGRLDLVSPEITGWRLDTTEGIGLFGAAAPLLYVKGYPRLYIGSSYIWEFPYPTASNPLIDHSMRMAGSFSLYHEHFDHNRFDKTKLIVDAVKKGHKKPVLRVCYLAGRPENCCYSCRKCLTIVNSLVALGEDPASYGFNTSADEANENTKAYFSLEREWKDYWYMSQVQQRIVALPSLSQEGKKQVEWLLSADLLSFVTTLSIKGKTKVNWNNFRDLAPQDIKIPSYGDKS